jgi:multidrug resistance efflux pump
METSTSASPASVDQVPTHDIAPTAPPRRRFKRSTRIAVTVILIMAVIAGAAFGVSYFLNARNYVSTDNAQIDGDKIMINAPASGTLLDWAATQGTDVHRNQVVGRIEIQGGFSRPQMPIKAPADGTVAMDNGVVGTYVTTGTELTVAYNLDQIYVTARVDETDVKAVRPGQVVDIDVDAYPNAHITGRVRDIQDGAAAVFSLFPQSNTGGNFQKVTQVVPVKISFADLSALNGLDLVPGMNVTVHIHKQP